MGSFILMNKKLVPVDVAKACGVSHATIAKATQAQKWVYFMRAYNKQIATLKSNIESN